MEMNATLLAQIPAGAPPPGVIPNFVNPYSTAQSGKIENVVCIVLTTTIVWAKMYTKLHIMRQSGWEDYTMLVSWATYIAYVGISFVPLDGGAGVHQWDLYLLPVIHSAEYLNIAEVLYVLSICLVKVSILLQLLRIFNPARNTALFVLAWGLIVINILLYTGVGLATIFQCNPREKIWNPLISGTCLNEYAIFISGAAMNLASDIILLILPLRSVWKLQMKLKQKLQVSAVFVVGLLACVSSLMRLIYSIQFLYSTDITFLWLPLALWCQAEITSGILCNCLPCLPRLYQHLFRKRDSSTQGSSTYYVNNSGQSKRLSNHLVTKSNQYVSIDEDGRSASVPKGTEDWVSLGPFPKQGGMEKQARSGV